MGCRHPDGRDWLWRFLAATGCSLDPTRPRPRQAQPPSPARSDSTGSSLAICLTCRSLPTWTASRSRCTDATCTWATTEAQCNSPLPSMTDGVHTIALAGLNPFSGLEGPQSEAITVQKVSARSVVSAVSAPNDAFSLDVIARGLRGPVQLAATPDGRLLIAEGDDRRARGAARRARASGPRARCAAAASASSCRRAWVGGSP